MSVEQLAQIWPEWEIEKQLGRGSYGVVYKAVRRDNNVESHAAIKVISIPSDESEVDSLRSEGLDMDGTRTYFKGIVDDFVSEIQLMESLKGIQNIVSVEDYKVVERTDSIGWDIYIRMELLTPFNTFVCDKKLSEKDVIKLGIDICTALEICGQRNIIHRDIKPENIFVNDFGYFKLGDFGIARKLENMTGGLSQKGTFNYMAPEVANSNTYDARVDTYSLGIVLYRLLNGNRLPFLDTEKQLLNPNERKNAVERRIRGEELPAPCEASPEMANLILCACAYNPDMRFASATDMKEALIGVGNGTYVPVAVDLDKTTAVRHAQADYDATTAVRKAPQAAGAPVQNTANSKNEAVPTFGKKKSKAPKIIAIVLVLALLIGGVFVAYPYVSDFLFEDTSETDDTDKLGDNTINSSNNSEQQPSDTNPSDTNPSETNPSETNPSDTNPSETNPSETMPATVQNIYVSYNGGMIPTGTEINQQDFAVVAVYSNGQTIETTDFSIAPSVIRTAGNHNITVEFEGKQAIVTVRVIHANDPNANPARDFKYETNNNEISILEYIGASETVIIPAIIDGKPVCSIEKCKSEVIKTVVIPDSVTYLGRHAFSGCDNLLSVTIGGGVAKMGDHVFYQCSNLKSVTLREGITTLGDSVFAYCPKIESVIIPNTVTSIEDGAFTGNTAMNLLVIGNCVETIGASAFSGCNNLQEVVIPDSVTYLGRHAFSGCSGLLRVTVGRKVSGMGDNVFYQCKKLSSVVLKDGISFLGDSMFAYCDALTEIVIPDSVSNITWNDGWDNPFRGCPMTTIYVVPGSYGEQWCTQNGLGNLIAYVSESE